MSPVADAEERAIHDYDGSGELRVEKYASFDGVSALVCFITEHGETGALLFDHCGGDVEEAMSDRYLGAHASLTGYVQESPPP